MTVLSSEKAPDLYMYQFSVDDGLSVVLTEADGAAWVSSESDAMFASLGAGVSTLGGLIPANNPATVAVKAICAAAVTAYFYSLRGVFKKAVAQGQCVELKYRIVGPAIVTGKVVKC